MSRFHAPEAARIVFNCRTANDPTRWIPLPKCRTSRHNLAVQPFTIRMKAIALATCAWLVSLPSEAQTDKDLSQTDVRKIGEATQTAMKAALAKDFATWAALFLGAISRGLLDCPCPF